MTSASSPAHARLSITSNHKTPNNPAAEHTPTTPRVGCQTLQRCSRKTLDNTQCNDRCRTRLDTWTTPQNHSKDGTILPTPFDQTLGQSQCMARCRCMWAQHTGQLAQPMHKKGAHFY